MPRPIRFAALAALLGCSDFTGSSRAAPGPRPSLSTAVQITVAELPSPTGLPSEAFSINEDGWIVGWSVTPENTYRAVMWRNGVATDLSPLIGGNNSQATDVNNLGQVVGFTDAVTDAPVFGESHGFVWEEGAVRFLDPTLCQCGILAIAINDLGQIVGSMSSGGTHAHLDGVRIASGEQSVAWDINNTGVVVGFHETPEDEQYAFSYSSGELTTFPSLDAVGTSTAVAINDKGQIVGWTSTGQGGRGFIISSGVMTSLPPLPGGIESSAYGINDNGQVVGYSVDATRTSRAVLWESGAVIELPAPSGQHTVAYRINTKGQAVGASYDVDATTGYWINQRPLVWTIRVTPPTPEEQVTELAADIDALAETGAIASNQAQALSAKLDATKRMLNESNTGAAINLLSAFVNQVQAFINAGKISAADGGRLIEAARAVIVDLQTG